jgi:hypothetical protein
VKAPPRPRKRTGWWFALVLLLAAAAGGWFAWRNPDSVASLLRRVRGAAAPAPSGTAAAPERRDVKAPARTAAAPLNRTPGSPAADGAAPVSPAPAGAPAATPAAAASASASAGAARVVVVHLPNLNAIGAGLVSQMRARLRAAGFDAVDKQLADPKNEPAWRLAPPAIRTAPPGKSGVVVAVYLTGFAEQADRACKILDCTSPPRAVDASDLKLFESSFQGRHIAVFAFDPDDAANPPGN